MEHEVNCDCAGCAAAPEAFDVSPNPAIMALRSVALAAATAAGALGLARSGNKKLIGWWLAAWGMFLTLPRYLICASCSGYGKMCYSYYLGRYTSMIFPKREKPVPMYSLFIEGACLSSIFLAPALAMKDDRKNLLTYLILSDLMLAGQFFHACRYCGTHADDDFKKHCPSFRFWNQFR